MIDLRKVKSEAIHSLPLGSQARDVVLALPDFVNELEFDILIPTILLLLRAARSAEAE